MINWSYSPGRGITDKINRRMTQWRCAAPARITNRRPIVTFTFDDFPKSAMIGADVLERFGGRGGFYSCTGLAGETGPMGDMFDAASIRELNERGHEIGAHTHRHLNCATASTDDVMSELDSNLRALRDMGLESPVTSFAYPYGETTFETKRASAKRFVICRGVLPGLNTGVVDRAQLRSVSVSMDSFEISRAQRAIDTACRSNGWLIFFTHDVSKAPTRYGMTVKLLEELCQQALDGGALLVPPTQAAVLAGIATP